MSRGLLHLAREDVVVNLEERLAALTALPLSTRMRRMSTQRVLAWLGREARARVAEHALRLEELGPIREHWVRPAIAAGDLFDPLAAETDAGVPA